MDPFDTLETARLLGDMVAIAALEPIVAWLQSSAEIEAQAPNPLSLSLKKPRLQIGKSFLDDFDIDKYFNKNAKIMRNKSSSALTCRNKRPLYCEEA